MHIRIPALAIVATLVTAGPAEATVRYVEPGPSAHHSLPCDSLNPCALDWALTGNNLPSGDTVIVEAGTYDVTAGPPDVSEPLIIQGDPSAGSVPLITSGGSFQPVLKFDTGAAGSSLSGVAITANGLAGNAGSGGALDVVVPMAIDHVAISSPSWGATLSAGDTLADATVSVTTAGGTEGRGLNMVPAATVHDVTVTVGGAGAPLSGIVDAGPTGGGEITDTSVTSGGTGIKAGAGSGAGIVMRRLRVSAQVLGITELTAPLTLTDSLVTSVNDALQADNGTITARNDTVVASAGAGLHAGRGGQSFLSPGTIDARNVIVRGGSADVVGDPVDNTSTGCTAAPFCQAGVVDIAYSNFRSGSGATDQGHNQSADPAFVNPASGDYHLSDVSPAIDAGTDDPSNGPTDLDRKPRTLGAAPDIGAYEHDALPTSTPPTGTPPPPAADTTPPGQSLRAKRKQKVTRLNVKDIASEDSILSAKARVHVPGLKRGSVDSRTTQAQAPANSRVKLRLGFRKRTLRLIKAALRDGGHLKAAIAVTATDAAGNAASARTKVKLRAPA
jgi:hypothetical protein